MASLIDITQPTAGNATTQSVRDNFAAAKNEIEENQTAIANLQAAVAAVLTTIYPVGGLYTTTLAGNPNTILGFGTWTIFGAGRVMVCKDATQVEFATLTLTGGEKTHTLITAEMPGHTHVQDAHNHTQDAHNHTQNPHNHPDNIRANVALFTQAGGTGWDGTSASTTGNTTATNNATTATNQTSTATNQNTGGDGAHNNLQPYIVVNTWQRTA